MNQTITLPRSAVEQALKALEADNSKLWPSEKRAAAITFLRERLEQPQVEQEPVAWIERWYGSGPERGWWIVCGRDHIAHLGPAEMSGEAASKIVSAHNTSPPAQRQPLTCNSCKGLGRVYRGCNEWAACVHCNTTGIGGEK